MPVQIQAPLDLATLGQGSVDLLLLEAYGYSSDGKTLFIRATFTDSGDVSNRLHYGMWSYDLQSQQYINCLNTLLAPALGVTARDLDVTSASIGSQGTALSVVTQSALRTNPGATRLSTLLNGEVRTTDLVASILGSGAELSIQNFKLSNDGRFLAVQTDGSSLAGDIQDTNDSADIYLIDLKNLQVTRVSTVGGSEVIDPVILSGVVSSGSTLKISFTSDAAFVSARFDKNSVSSLDTTSGAKSDAYVWSTQFDQSGLNGKATFTLVSTMPSGIAAGYTDSNNVIATTAGVFFNSSSSEIVSGDANNASDVFFQAANRLVTRLSLTGIQELSNGASIVSATSDGKFALLLTSSPEVVGSAGLQELVLVNTQSGNWKIVSKGSSVANDIVLSGSIDSLGLNTVFTSAADNLVSGPLVAASGSLFIAPVNSPPTGVVTLAGAAIQGQTLNASNTLLDADGLGTITYQWRANGANIGGVTGATYALTQAQVGKTIDVVASYTDLLGSVESVTSAVTTAVSNINDSPTGTVSISGTATQNQILTVLNTLADLDGLGTMSYQWLSDANVIGGATESTFALTQAQVGYTLSVRASYVDGFGVAESVTSGATAAVVNVNDLPVGSVTITGSATQGNVLRARNTLADADGLGAIAYQWQANGTNIAGATNAVYIPSQEQVGQSIAVVASYTDLLGAVESVTSNSTAIVVAATDLAAPLLLRSSPIDNASKVVASSNVTLVFNEAIKAGSGSIILTNTLNASDNRTFSITDATQVTVSGSSVVINPSSDLLLGAHYALTTAAGTITDLAGNAFAGISDTAQLDFTVSSQKTKYFVLSSSANFTDFNLGYTSASLASEQVTFVGSSQVDAIFVRPGTPVDYTLSGAAADKIYLSGNLTDYTATISGSVMTLQRGADSNFESVSFIKGTSTVSSDVLIFANGTLSSFDLYNNLKSATPLPTLGTSETSLAPLTSAASSLSATIKAFALNSAGDTFAPTSPDQAMITVGGAGVDTVYVPNGGVVDATLLGGGQDVIYFRGAWGDYTKTLSGSVMTFSRAVDGHNESVKVVAGSSLSLNDQLTFADGTVHSYDAKAAIVASAAAPLSAVTGLDTNTVTPGFALALKASALDNVTNFEVTSDIVLNYSETVSAVAGKYIHIVNDGGNGFHGESTNNTLNILTSDTTQVTISGSKVTINPTADLDLANTYHVAVDAGAFTGVSSHLSTSAFDGTTSLNFSTVTPGTSSLANAAVSQTMDANGVMTAGHAWLDIEGIGNPAAASATALDLSTANVALVAKDYDATGAVASAGYDGIATGDFYVAANNFAAGDLLYIDNQSALKNDVSLTVVVNPGHAPTRIQFAGNGGLGGLVDVTVAGTGSGFDDLAVLKNYLYTSTPPVITA